MKTVGQRIVPLEVENTDNLTLVDISTADNGTKNIHFLGYGYLSDNAPEGEPLKIARWLEYIFFEAPLEEALKYGVSKLEADTGSEYKQCIEDITEAELEKIIKAHPVLYECDLSLDTPDGVYFLYPAPKDGYKVRQASAEICDLFEDLLDAYGIVIPSSDREGEPNERAEGEACLYGEPYTELEDAVTDILVKVLKENAPNAPVDADNY
ncbi:MAG: hypothetical protein IKA41_04870 [Bacteroidaceae bacterium]|nr:hypothetical protein [Bacteroidaceae bacterium]